MISSNIQLLSWLVSIVIGLIYYHIINVFYRFTSRYRLFIRIFFDILFIFILTSLFIYIYLKVNNGFIHYSFVIFWFLGYLLSNIVNIYVKRQKKSKYPCK